MSRLTREELIWLLGLIGAYKVMLVASEEGDDRDRQVALAESVAIKLTSEVNNDAFDEKRKALGAETGTRAKA